MSSEDVPPNEAQIDVVETPKSPTGVTENENKKRPRLDLGAGRERKRGKSMFGILVGTLNKAKIEDKERNASEAAKKRQLIDQRLQAKLRKETDSVRRAEEAKKDKTAANRKEEELQLKDSIYKLRRTRLPILANFLFTSDVIPSDDSPPTPSSTNPLAPIPRSHPPPLCYLPAILTPTQEAFVIRRKTDVIEAAEKEWDLFREERTAGIDEINRTRQRVAEEEAARKSDKILNKDEMETDAPVQSDQAPTSAVAEDGGRSVVVADGDSTNKVIDMDVDDAAGQNKANESERKEEPTSLQADDDDAVEY
ncbi:hypothetical protein BYT27DRAFT_7142640 [Phlegmacium glaucopus]|nr:hypothetical protein BYT27DRAFT_7142640 [Phlegmacium glaucopus]